MKRLFLLCALFAVINGYSQNHFVGVKAGANFTNAIGDFAGSNHLKTGLTTGVSYEYFFKDHFSLTGEILYDQRGYVLKAIEPSVEVINKFSYLAIPIKMSFVKGSRFYGIASAGLVPAFLLKAGYDYPEELSQLNGDISPGEVEITDKLKKVDLSGLIEIGCGYKFSKRIRAFTSLSGQISFNTFTTDDYLRNVDAKHYGFALSAGIKYALSVN